VNRLLKESSDKTAAFRSRAEEALRKQRESEEARKKSNLRLAEAIGKFQSNRHMLLEQQTILETEKSRLILEKETLERRIEMVTKETTRTVRRNREIEKTLEENHVALQAATKRIRDIETGMER